MEVNEPLENELRILFDQDWYLERYPDVRGSGIAALRHYVNFGIQEGRDPNSLFAGAWYREHYPDVAWSGLDPLLHYLNIGARELRNPHPRFNAQWYVEQHPEAAANPLVYHMLFGRLQNWATEPPIDIDLFLPAASATPFCPPGVVVDVIVPVYRGIIETHRCLELVLADPQRPPGRVIVIDDASPDPALSAWLDELKRNGRILLIRNQSNLGFVASVNIGLRAAGDHDVALLNADTEVPRGWLSRLAGHAYAGPRTASVSPFSNNATICGYPSISGSDPALGLSVEALDAACRAANGGRRVEVPTTVGFCMYIRRDALDDVGPFDAAAFGRGYGEENDFCLRAATRGWRHVLACDTYVFHKGNVSFGSEALAQFEAAQALLARRWPNYKQLIEHHIRFDPAAPFRFAVTAWLFRHAERPVLLMVSHGLGGGVARHIEKLAGRIGDRANVLLLECTARGATISVPTLRGHSAIALPADREQDLLALLRSAGVTRVHVHHVMAHDFDLRRLIHRLAVPFDVTVHDYFTICPQVNLLPWLDGQYLSGAGSCRVQCLHCRPAESRCARHHLVASRPRLAVPRSRARTLSKRRRAEPAGPPRRDGSRRAGSA